MSSSDQPSSDERSTREWVLQAGLEILDRDGLGLGPDSLSYAKVFAYLEQQYSTRVTRGSVHERIWASHDDFRLDVVAEMVEHLPKFDCSEMLVRLDPVYRELPVGERVDSFCRNELAEWFLQALQSPAFQQLQLTKAVSARVTELRTVDMLQSAFNRQTQEELAVHRERFPSFLTHLGLKLRSDLGLTTDQASDLFCVMSHSLLSGSLFNYHAGNTATTNAVRFMSVESDDEKPWLVFSVGIRSFFNFLFEIDLSTVPDEGSPITSPLPSEPPSKSRLVDADVAEFGSRRTRQQLRQLLLTAGAEMLLRDGLVLKPESLTYAKVFAYLQQNYGIKVSQGSVHKRLWDNLEDFQLDVLVAGCIDSPHDNPALMLQALDDQTLSALRSDETIHRRHAARNLLRVFTGAIFDQVSSSPSFHRRLLVKAALCANSGLSAPNVLQTAIVDSDEVRIDRYKLFIRDQILSLGLETRPELGLAEHEALDLTVTIGMTSMGGAIFEGLAGIEAMTNTFDLPRVGDSTQLDKWKPGSLTAIACFTYLFTPTVDE